MKKYSNVIGIPSSLAQSVGDCKLEAREISEAKKTGEGAYKRAIWVPCDRLVNFWLSLSCLINCSKIY